MPDTSNFGHYATSFQILNRLIALGVQSFTVIFGAADPDEPVWPKFQKFLPDLPDESPDGYTQFQCSGVPLTFIGPQAFEARRDQLDEVPFCITGGWDSTQNVCTVLKVRTFIVLQPFQWDGIPDQPPVQNLFFTADTPEDHPGINICQSIPRLNDLCYFRPDVPRLIQDGSPLASLQNRELVQMLRFLSKESNENTLLLSAIYFTPGRPDAVPSNLLFNLSCGILQAGFNRPVVIALIAPLPPDELSDFRVRIDSYSRRDGTLPSCIRQRYPNLSDQISTLHPLTLPNLRSKLGPGRIIFVPLGLLPRVAFDFLFTNSNLVSIFEGAGTTSLAVNLGQPYLRLTSDGCDPSRFYPNPQLPATQATQFSALCQGASRALAASEDDWTQQLDDEPTSTPDILLANFLRSAQIRQSFAQQRAFFHNEDNDRLLVALLEYMRRFNPEH